MFYLLDSASILKRAILQYILEHNHTLYSDFLHQQQRAAYTNFIVIVIYIFFNYFPLSRCCFHFSVQIVSSQRTLSKSSTPSSSINDMRNQLPANLIVTGIFSNFKFYQKNIKRNMF